MVGERKSLWFGQLLRLPFYLIAFTVMIPFYWMVLGAFKTLSELLQRPPTFVVLAPTVKNFFNADYAVGKLGEWQGLFQRYPNGLGFWGFYFNSLMVTLVVVFISLMLASLVAYVLVKHPFPGSKILFMVLLGSMMIPWEVTIIPNFIIVRDLGWLNSFWALMVPGMAKAFVVFFFRQAILSVPNELVDAARIDGAGEVRIWWYVVMPILRPALAAIAIPVALGEWNNFLWPLLVINDDAHSTLPLALGKLAGSLNYDPKAAGVLMAASLLVSIPAVTFFLVFQRQFVQGLSLGATKG